MLYGKPYAGSAERTTDMPAWPHWYNHHPPNAGIRALTPATRLNNLLGNKAAGSELAQSDLRCSRTCCSGTTSA